MRFTKIYIEITNICNLKCSFCSDDKRNLREMSEDEFEQVLRKIKGYTKTIYLHVKGEPLIHSKFEIILDIAKKYNFNVKITTNGTLLNKKLDIINKFDNIKQINISLHSENNNKNYFEDVFFASNILSKKINIVYRIWTLNNYKLNKLSTTIVDKIIKYYKLDNKFKDLVTTNNNLKIKDNIYLDKENMFIWPTNNNDNKNAIGTCLGTRNQIAILSDGTVTPCCLDSKGIINFGNIFKKDLETIIKSKTFQEINTGFKNNKLSANLCKNCNFRILRFK